MMNERVRVEMGIPLDLISSTIAPLAEFRNSKPGILVLSLLAKASTELAGGFASDGDRNKHLRRVQRETTAILTLLHAGPSEAHPSPLDAFHAAINMFDKVIKIGKLPIHGKIGYMQITAFIENLVSPKEGDLSILGETINNGRITALSHAMLGVAMSRGYYLY